MCVEQRDLRILIQQGKTLSRLGFVRRGESIEMLSREDCFHILRLRGVEFFRIPFPEPDQLRTRTLNCNGVVELDSGAGRFWMRGYLFVMDHPYATRTSKRGRFSLEQVPEGEYELVAWMPNWHVKEVCPDPGTNLAREMTFCPPVELHRRVYVRRGAVTSLELEVSERDFQPR